MGAKTQMLQALIDYRTENGITGDDLIRVSSPGEDDFDSWREASGMDGDPATAVIALRVEGYGAFYPSVKAAIEEIDQYFMAD